MKKMNLLLIVIMALSITMPATFSFAADKTSKTSSATLTQKININTASVELLTQVRGIGPKTAENVIAYRNANGKFQKIDDLVNVKGIGPKTLKKIKSSITI